MLSKDQQAFLVFHTANPEVEKKLTRMALELLASGVKQWSVWPLYGTLRYTDMLQRQTDRYKMANGHIAYYARLIMQNNQELRGFFTIRGDVELPDTLRTPKATNE
jgi:hypothetical protein